jgi:hypothetical protein
VSPQSEVEKLLGPGSERAGMWPELNLAAERFATLEYLRVFSESLLSGEMLSESFHNYLQSAHVESLLSGAARGWALLSLSDQGSLFILSRIEETHAPRTRGEVEAPIPVQMQRRLTSLRQPISRDREMRWLAENRDRFVGQWVVVEGDRLIASGPNSQEVFQAAKQAGIEIPFLVQVEPEDQLPFGGW